MPQDLLTEVAYLRKLIPDIEAALPETEPAMQRAMRWFLGRHRRELEEKEWLLAQTQAQPPLERAA